MMSDVYNLTHEICGTCGRYVCECRENRAAAEWYEFEPIPVDEIRRGGGVSAPGRVSVALTGNREAMAVLDESSADRGLAQEGSRVGNPARLVESRPVETCDAGVCCASEPTSRPDQSMTRRDSFIDRAPGNVAGGELGEPGPKRVAPGSFEHEPVYGGERTVFSAYAVCLSAVVGAAICVCVWLGLIG